MAKDSRTTMVVAGAFVVAAAVWWYASRRTAEHFKVAPVEDAAHDAKPVCGAKRGRCQRRSECAPCKMGQLPMVNVPHCYKFDE